MRIISVVPSKGRPDGLSAKTLSWLCFSKHDYKVFVEPQDYEAYLKVVDPDHLVMIDDNDRGLGYVKHFIQKWLDNQPYDLVFKLDDDVRRFTGRGKNLTDPEANAKRFDDMLAECAEAFEKYPDLGAVSYPYRWELYEVKKWVSINSRLQTCYLIRKNLFKGDPRVSTFEDFYNYLQIRSRNKLTMRYGKLGIDADVGKAEGGLQSFDRAKMAEAEIAVLRETYPALQVKKVDGKRWGIEPVLRGEFFGVKNL